MSSVYESEVLIQAHGGSMHPGGLRLTDRAARLAALREGMRVADIGCGTGATALFLTGKYKLQVVGLEISGALIDIGLKKSPGLNLIRWDCASLPFEDNSLDAILFECTLSLLGDTRHILAQCAKALKKTGAVIISDIYYKHPTRPEALRITDNLPETLAASGFDVIVREDHTAALRTYAAELRAKNDAGPNNAVFDAGAMDICSFLGASGDCKDARLSELGYMLTIARII